MLVLLLAGWLLWRFGVSHRRNVLLDAPRMVLVRGGSFEMGDLFGDGDLLWDGDSDENPLHTVTLSDFYIGKTEVTLCEFRAFVEATGYKTDAEKCGKSWVVKNSDGKEKAGVNWRHDEEGKTRNAENYPVLHVSWNDAVAYCNWLSERQGLRKVYSVNGDKVKADWSAEGYRLPTEAEWEYAARSGGKIEKFAGFSDEKQLYRHGNYCDISCDFNLKIQKQNDGFRCSAPVGRFEPNGLGLHDMTGNVWEWCWDWYSGYSPEAQKDPHGPDSGTSRVGRGGGWLSVPWDCRAAIRSSSTPTRSNESRGFRLVRSSF